MILLWFLACEEEALCPDTPTYENWAEGFFVSKCQPSGRWTVLLIMFVVHLAACTGSSRDLFYVTH